MSAKRAIFSAAMLLSLAAGPPRAAAAAGDVAATSTYIRANYAFVRAARAQLSSSQRGLSNVLARVAGECPHAASLTPQNEQSEHLSNEVIGALVIEADKPNLAAARRFLRTVGPLRWSDGSLNRELHTYTRQLATLSKLAPPNVCADVRAWVSGGHTTLPASTVAFDGVFLPNWVVVGRQPHGLTRFESGETRSLAKRTMPLELQLADFEAYAVYKWADVLNALELGP